MLVELEAIHKHYGPLRANDGVSLRVEPGTIHGLLGENGAGKSTLMKILSGFIQPDSGAIRLDGRPAHFHIPAEAIQHGVGMLHQDPLDFPALTVLDNFTLGRTHGLVPDRRAARQELARLVHQFGFDLQPDELVSRLSVGARQQLEIVRLIALGVRVLILDEPTTGISAAQKDKLFGTLRQLAESGRSVIFVSHKLEDIEALCHAVTVLRRGKVTGRVQMPVPAEHLVRLMFGQILEMTAPARVDLGSTVLSLQQLTLAVGRLRLHDLNLQVRAGEVIGLAGLEGSGQGAFLQACAGLLRPVGGQILVAGRNMTGRSYQQFRNQGVAYLAPGRLEEGLVPGLTIAEHLVLADPRRPAIIDWARAEQIGQERIAQFRIRGRPDSPVESLSGGNQQRTLLALLPPNVRVVLLDNPTRGLDIESILWIWNILLARREAGTAVLFASADLDEIVTYSDRVLVFSGGKATEVAERSQMSTDRLGYLIGGGTR